MKDIWNEIMADTNHSTGSSQDKTNTGQLEGSVEDDGDQESNESAVNREDRGARDISEFDVDGRQALSDFLVDISLHALEGELTQAGITSIRHLARSTLQDLENAGVSFLFQRRKLLTTAISLILFVRSPGSLSIILIYFITKISLLILSRTLKATPFAPCPSLVRISKSSMFLSPYLLKF